MKNEVNINTNVKEWYKATYPKDKHAEEIKDDITFNDVLAFLIIHIDVDEMTGIKDPTIRNRVIDVLSRLMNSDWANINHLWQYGLGNHDVIPKEEYS